MPSKKVSSNVHVQTPFSVEIAAALQSNHTLFQFIQKAFKEILPLHSCSIHIKEDGAITAQPFVKIQHSDSALYPAALILLQQQTLSEDFIDAVFSTTTVKLFSIKQSAYAGYKWTQPLSKTGVTQVVTGQLHLKMGTTVYLQCFIKRQGSLTQKNTTHLQSYFLLLADAFTQVIAKQRIQELQASIQKYEKYLSPAKSAPALNSSNKSFITQSPALQDILDRCRLVANSNTTVLITGETGTGKELIARMIHQQSPRRDQPLIYINCGAIPSGLIESELFGHEKGSFTGATERKAGKFELAHKGTLFLDEIGELPLELQAKLLRVLQEREVERIGARQPIAVDVRIIAATNRHLASAVAAGNFRSDLFYRLQVFPLEIPPLRTRKEDIPLLAQHFIQQMNTKLGKKVKGLSTSATAQLQAYQWPGNVRELEHQIEKAMILCKGNLLAKIDLPILAPASPKTTVPTFEIKPLKEMEKAYLLQVVKTCNGRIAGPKGAAALLKIPPTTLISKMQKLGLKKAHR